MATYPTHIRKLEAVKIVVRLEGMKDKEKRELGIDEVIAKARKIDEFVREVK